MKKVLVGFLMGWAGTYAQATPVEYFEVPPRMEVTLGAGAASHSGYLTQADASGVWNFGVSMESRNGLMSFEWSELEAEHDTGEFALANNRRVQVSVFSFIPYFKFYERPQWGAYLGLGLSQVSLSQEDPDYRTLFGTFIFSGILRYNITSKWSVHLKSQWYGPRQTINNQDTGFEVWNNFVGIGWNIL